MNNYRKGIYFALITAIVSGVAVFISSFATKVVKDPFVLTTLRNVIVAIWLSAVLIGISSWQSIKQLTFKQWSQLILIGLIGGSIPFLLFFKGLSLSTASGGALIHKTLFIWVGILAVIFLKEKTGKLQIFALIILLAGNYLLSVPKSWNFGLGEILVFIAVLFWAVETIIAKVVLKNIPAVILAWGRMFFGSIIMLGFLFFTDRFSIISTLNSNQWLWIILPCLLLFSYVILWYNSLKYSPASLVTSILVLGSLVTTLLSSIFIIHKYQLSQIISYLLLIIGIVLFIKFLPRTKNVQNRQLTVR
ncbi:hypothetical protein A3F08_02290 [Candidatus Berkelbacteria bacterium RIFCSPHIGHO2_12_FULL_36_9]|uniref:EamA domain-containing protein n=1 Tax=Candidatus Berkelbacteria bacterium RIFCSPHIGHO2_12_FULL_36_9 TaxID=1797469 RepID=A0A1F5EGH5_9BACT|nr:MAG: hypothetical protein A3F08_02290 [Candidatus Berkelbacteria bacterium RIFCSPHIGHO2_12_FULL_36_9]